MRPVFLPDGSLLLGQTGRGWQAKGGKVAALQHVTWDGKTVAPQIVAMIATPEGFRIDLTQPLGDGVSEAILRSALSLESWTYRDAPDYGSPELDLHDEGTTALVIARGPQVHRHQAGVDRAEAGASAPDRARVSREARVADAVRCECVGGVQCVLHAACVSGEFKVAPRCREKAAQNGNRTG